MMQENYNSPNFGNFINVIFFTIFLLPFSILPGFSSNYLFIFYPLILIFLRQRVLIPQSYLLAVMIFYFLVFILSLMTQMELSHLFSRRIISFIIYMSAFSFIFISINKDQIIAFKISIVLYSLIFIVPSFYLFFSSGEISFGEFSNPKEDFGSQRYGFVYIMAFWLTYFFSPKKSFLIVIVKYLVLGLLLTGILMTFSRSSVVSLIASIVTYIIFEVFFSKVSINLRIKKLFIFTIALSFLFFAIIEFAPLLITFFDRTFFSLFIEQGFDGFELANENSSIGYRLFMLNKILDFVAVHPFTGSGYLGVWIMFSDLSGSAHNQYTDVLFRVGLIGLIIYIFLLMKIISFLYKSDKGLFYGFIGVVFYGVFHETFKLSHGSFILSFLLALAFQRSMKSAKIVQ